MKEVGLRYAGVAGLLFCVVFIVSYAIGVHPFIEMSHLFFDLFIYGLVIYFAVNEFKKLNNEGGLHFWQGMSIGFLVNMVSLTLYMIFLFIAMNFNDLILADYKIQASDFLIVKSVKYIESYGADQYNQQVQAIEDTTILNMVFMAGVKKFISGLFMTPLISILLRRNYQ